MPRDSSGTFKSADGRYDLLRGLGQLVQFAFNLRQRWLTCSAEHLGANEVRQAAGPPSRPCLLQVFEFNVGEAKHHCPGPWGHFRPAVSVATERLPAESPRFAAPAVHHIRIHLKGAGDLSGRSPHLQAADRGRLTFFSEDSSLGSHAGSRYHPATT